MSITSTATGSADCETGGTHSAHSARKNRALWATQVLLAAVFAFAAMRKPRPAAVRAVRGKLPGDPQLRQVARKTI